jgi:transposase
MGYSNDLRVRVIQVIEAGAAARAAARQFVIGDATAVRWAKRWRETGSFEAKSNRGQSRSPLKKHEEWLLDLVRQEPDLTLEEIQCRLLEERQQKAAISAIWRFFDRHSISFKKSVRAAEQDRPDVAAARMAWAENQSKFDPDRLILSTKVVPTPRWRGCVAVLPAANGWLAKSHTVIGKLRPSLRACGQAY